MKKQILAISIIGILFFFSCNSNQNNRPANIKDYKIDNLEYSIIGKKGKITFPEMEAEVNYTSDSTLHWKTINDKGIISEGDEKISYQKLSDNLYFFNWIEKDGFTVSQIIDTKKYTVKAFWSFNDEKSQHGKRSSSFVDGKFQFIK